MKQLRFEKRFAEDLAVAIKWYEQVPAATREKLRKSIGDRVRSIRSLPESFQMLSGGRGHRGATIPGFPWMIVFRVENGVVRLLRIVHLASDWRQ